MINKFFQRMIDSKFSAAQQAAIVTVILVVVAFAFNLMIYTLAKIADYLI